MSNTVSADSIKAQMRHPLFPVLGVTTHNKGHLGLLQDPAIYLVCNRGAFNIPAKEP